MYRNIVQKIIADCLMVPNLWILKREQEEVSRWISTHDHALHYRDYEYECYKANLSLLKNANVGEDNSLRIGHTAYCIDCSGAIYDTNSLYCDRCSDDGYITCYDCDHRVREDDARYIDGHWYCEECCSYCEHCQEYATGEMTEVYGRQDYSYYVCQDCLDNYYHCENCGDYFHEDKGQQLDDGSAATIAWRQIITSATVAVNTCVPMTRRKLTANITVKIVPRMSGLRWKKPPSGRQLHEGGDGNVDL